jgi:hypothetical protein
MLRWGRVNVEFLSFVRRSQEPADLLQAISLPLGSDCGVCTAFSCSDFTDCYARFDLFFDLFVGVGFSLMKKRTADSIILSTGNFFMMEARV